MQRIQSHLMCHVKAWLTLHDTHHMIWKFDGKSTTKWWMAIATNKKFSQVTHIQNLVQISSGHSQTLVCFAGPDLGPNCLQRLSADGISIYYIESKHYVIQIRLLKD